MVAAEAGWAAGGWLAGCLVGQVGLVGLVRWAGQSNRYRSYKSTDAFRLSIKYRFY